MFPERDAGRTVAMPRSKSEPTGTGPHPSKMEQHTEQTGIWHGRLIDVAEEFGITPARKGKNDKMIAPRKWTKYTIIAEGDVAFTTFSSTDALLARCAIAGEERVEVQWERDAYDGMSITSIDEITQPPEMEWHR